MKAHGPVGSLRFVSKRTSTASMQHKISPVAGKVANRNSSGKNHHTHRRERSLAVVDVPDGADVNVRLAAFEGRQAGGASCWQSWFRGTGGNAQSAAALQGLGALGASTGRRTVCSET